jgi:predicted dehydrogenase
LGAARRAATQILVTATGNWTRDRASVALFGCGWAGARHAEAWNELGVEVAWAVDSDADKSETFADKFGGQATASWELSLADQGVTIVDICLPHALHAQAAIAAATRRKHILCEKPLAISLEDADRMIEAADRAGVVLMVAENVCFDPARRRLAELVHQGAIGRPALLQIAREANLARSFLSSRRWFLDEQVAGGGIMLSGGVHDFETARMLLGEIEQVGSLRAPRRLEEMGGDDTSVAVFRFASGAIGVLVESYVAKRALTAGGDEHHTVRVDGEYGSLLLENQGPIRLFSEETFGSLSAGTEHVLPVEPVDTFRLELEHLLDALEQGFEPISSGRSQRRAIELVSAAYASMDHNGEPIFCSAKPDAPAEAER